MRRRALAVVILVAAAGCARPSYPPALPAAGSPHDDGTGVLYRASVRYETAADGTPERFADDTPRTTGYGEGYGGFAYGGGLYGGGAYGGVSYAGWQANGNLSPVSRQPSYAIRSLADAGGVAGTVTWKRAPTPRRLRSPCGEIDNPTLRVGPRAEAGGAIVYLDKIAAGRPLAMGNNRPLAIGGTVERVGCVLLPTTQVVAPVPATITLFDGRGGVAAVHAAGADPVELTVAPGGHRTVGIGAGVTVVTAGGSRAVPAWIVAPGHPYATMTDDAGRFRIDDVVPGTYHLVVWHPPVVTGWVQGKPQYGAPVIVTRTIRVGANATTTQAVALP
jgi:hypothetical protein